MKGAWLRHVTRFKFWVPHAYVRNGWSWSSQTLYKGRLYQVRPKGWQITPKSGVVLLTWPIFVCATVDLEKIWSWHAVIGGSNKIDDVLLLITPTVVKATLRLKAHLHQARLCPSRDGCRRASTSVNSRRRAWFGHAFHFAWIVIRSRHLIKMASDSDSVIDEIVILTYFHTRRKNFTTAAGNIY